MPIIDRLSARAAMRVAGACAALALTAQAPAPVPAVKLWRLDCGTVAANDLNRFSDTDAYRGKSMMLAASCYLIRHGDTYMLWDTGIPAAKKGHVPDPKLATDATLRKTIVEQLAEIGVKPADIAIVGISHYHFDHTGQAADFPNAKLLIGKADFDELSHPGPGSMANAAPLAHWVGGSGTAEPVSGDKDVFGDGSVRMIDLPGHTPGHHALLVRLAHTGAVFLSGDVSHFHENYDSGGVPSFNTNRAATLASLDRFKALAANDHALIVLQHDPRDITKLPAFPKAAD